MCRGRPVRAARGVCVARVRVVLRMVFVGHVLRARDAHPLRMPRGLVRDRC